MKPNFHFATHISVQIQDYGPVHGFWTFVGERLNKVLKGFNLNNWGGGQLEITMMRAFNQDVHLREIVSIIFSIVQLLISCIDIIGTKFCRSSFSRDRSTDPKGPYTKSWHRRRPCT
jgi:hypothetical protein